MLCYGVELRDDCPSHLQATIRVKSRECNGRFVHFYLNIFWERWPY